jgi:HlyD family secretion protein
MRNKRKIIVGSLVFLLSAGGVSLAFMPKPVVVDQAVVRRGEFTMAKTGIARARVTDRYIITAPVPGHLSRVSLRAGDQVTVGQAIAHIDAVTVTPMDARTRAELVARTRAAEAAESEARMAVERARVVDDQAKRELERTRALVRDQALPQAQLEEIEALALTRGREVALANLSANRLRREVEVTRATLTDAKSARHHGGITVLAPTSGKVLRVITQSEGPVGAGTPLIELGDPASLECVVELPTADAVGVKPGAEVEFVRWGGPSALRGKVRLIEPSAFTKLTALGIEEQRVNVIVEPLSDSHWAAIGDGYQMDARITVYHKPEATVLPVGAAFREGNAWAVFVVANERASKRVITVAEKADTEVEIQQGLRAGDTVILYPGDQVRDGQRVKKR